MSDKKDKLIEDEESKMNETLHDQVNWDQKKSEKDVSLYFGNENDLQFNYGDYYANNSILNKCYFKQ